jgi:hypothetical protein
LVIYFLVLRLLTNRLSKSFPNFYKEERLRILSINSLIIGSIFIRIIVSILNGIDSFNKLLVDSFKNNTVAYPLIQFSIVILTSLLPIATIIYSLMNAIN